MKKVSIAVDQVLSDLERELGFLTGSGQTQVKYGIIMVNSAQGEAVIPVDDQLTGDGKKSPEIEEN